MVSSYSQIQFYPYFGRKTTDKDQFLHLPLAASEKGMQTDKASLFLLIIPITYLQFGS